MDADNQVRGELIEVVREDSSQRKTKVAAEERLAWAKGYATKHLTSGPAVVMAAVKEHFGVGVDFYLTRELLESLHPGKSKKALMKMWAADRENRRAAGASTKKALKKELKTV